MIENEEFKNLNDHWRNTIEKLSIYKDISEQTLERCDESFIETKKKICQDFDTIINYLTDRKIELLQQLGEELEAHKQQIESNRDKSMMLIEQLNKKMNSPSKFDINSNSSGGGGVVFSGGGGLSHSTSYSGNLSNYLSASSGFASSPLNYSTSSLMVTNNNNNNNNPTSPLKKSTSFQTDYLQVLKESISYIEWDWKDEFQENNTTNRKIIKQPKPISSMASDLILNSSFKSFDDLNKKFQEFSNNNDIDDDDDDDTNNNNNNNNNKDDFDNFENNNNNGDSLKMNSNKKLKIFGKLKFKIIETLEYKRLNSNLEDTKCIYSIGGKCKDGFDQYSIEKFDFKQGLWRSLQSIPSIMDNDFTGNFDGKNHIYLFGGSLQPTRILKYNLLEDQWEKIETNNNNNNGANGANGNIEIPDNGRFLHCSVFDGKQNIYLIGGFPRSTSILKFNIITEQFSKQQSKSTTSSRNLWSMGAIYKEDNNSIYLIGGCNITRQSVDTLERYDIDNDSFTTLSPLPVSCYGAGVFYDDQEHYIYVLGGYNSKENKCLSIIQRYDLLDNSWSVLTDDHDDHDDDDDGGDSGSGGSGGGLQNLLLPKPMMINGNSIIFDSSKRIVHILGGYNNVTKESIDDIYTLDISNILDENLSNKINWEVNKIPQFKNSKFKGGTSILIQK
ncbi:hypothetical protein ACTFIW_004000 [Dictyostelium discoideum]